MMTHSELDKLKELAERATPGPWGLDCTDGYASKVTYNHGDGLICQHIHSNSEAEYIAAVSPDVVLKLISEVKIARRSYDEQNAYCIGSLESLRAQLAEAREVLKTISTQGRLKGYPTGPEWIELEAAARAYLEKYK